MASIIHWRRMNRVNPMHIHRQDISSLYPPKITHKKRHSYPAQNYWVWMWTIQYFLDINLTCLVLSACEHFYLFSLDIFHLLQVKWKKEAVTFIYDATSDKNEVNAQNGSDNSHSKCENAAFFLLFPFKIPGWFWKQIKAIKTYKWRDKAQQGLS